MALSDTKLRKLKPKAKPYKVFDEKGLFLNITPTGGQWWRLRYTFDQKEKLLSLGTYPEISLSLARERQAAARSLVAQGIDPSAKRKAQKAAKSGAGTLEVIAREWFEKFTPTWTPGHARTIASRLARDIYPDLGTMEVQAIKAPDVLRTLRRIEARGALETAHRIRSILSQVLRFAVATGRAETDCTADLRGALPPAKEVNHAAVTDPTEFAGILRAIWGYQGSDIVRAALKLQALWFLRPGELRTLEWADVDLSQLQVTLPAERMKMREPLAVPLANQALTILQELKPLTMGSRYVFPSATSEARPMSNNAVLSALRRMGIDKADMSGHGFRSSARTMLDEVLGERVDLIEHQLAHKVRDVNGRAYNRTTHLPERRKMMQRWADYLDTLRTGGNVIAGKFGRVA